MRICTKPLETNIAMLLFLTDITYKISARFRIQTLSLILSVSGRLEGTAEQ